MKTLILGIGNLLWADEGFGIRCVEHMDAIYAFDGSVELMDGGTQGIYLVHHVQEADNLIIFDAVDYGMYPGEIRVVVNDAVPNFMGCKKMSLHQTGFQEVLSTAKLMGGYPKKLALIGVQPKLLEDFGGSLTSEVNEQIGPCVEIAMRFLEKWGVEYMRKESLETDLVTKELNKTKYESERPPEWMASRIGDERVLVSENYRLREMPLYEGISNVKPIPVDGRKLFEGSE
ncbi:MULTISPECIES: HyaD/HybD family hydrogenase maturation endopeptidase [Thiomicrorhabdus]|uniref:HyaD/HybD family hydrogenase maturation endopeptidase n=1 Tax=Thiomicrorhabdus heinhorstiae TaxID=2748010 RepID=A0ABS0BV11_9GAMM|nr:MULTISPECIES: HyaD/HybD family hydrogenase maturation endopeptidase [Thiomicrorhabdus]MBF6057672.1 HyaD/HybD family hydrogenase maturation endopeptidase [Thiomicrorhabdus heinhorstiae]